MREIGIQEIEDIALGAALLGAGGGGDPYIGKLTAIGAVKECGPVKLISADEVPEGAFIMPGGLHGRADDPHGEGVGSQRVQAPVRHGVAVLRQARLRDHAHGSGRRQLDAPHRRSGAPGHSHGRRRRHGTRVPRASNGHVHHRRSHRRPRWPTSTRKATQAFCRR